MGWWVPYVAASTPPSGLEIVPLRRLDRRGIRAWSASYESSFQDEESRQRLLELTAGWPILVERADALIGEDSSTAQVLSDLQITLKKAHDLDSVLASTLAGAPAVVGEVFTMLAQAPSVTMSADDLAEVAEGECSNPGALVEALRSLGVLSVTDAGELGAEPVMARAWLSELAST
jgi:hypothetical protein